LPEHPVAPRVEGGQETILVVEDEESLREVFARILRSKGYRVLSADSGDAAIQLVQEDPEPIHLLLTDVVLPGMTGAEVARILTGMRPALRVLFMSGYTEDAIVRRGVLEHEIDFLAKPFDAQQVLRRVREVLDSRP